MLSEGVASDSIVIPLPPGPENGPGHGPGHVVFGPNEVDSVQCDCCGLSEECTLSYIETVRDRYGGKWICGLCGEAIKYEVIRCQKLLISPDEALTRHVSFCNEFRASGPPEDQTGRLIRVMKRVLSRSLDSPKLIRSMPSSPINNRVSGDNNDVRNDDYIIDYTNNNLDLNGNSLARSESCMPSLTMVESIIDD